MLLNPHGRVSEPYGAHKLTAEIVAFCAEQLAANPTLRSADLADQIADRFGVRVHPRSVERALARSRMPKSTGR